MDSQIDADGRYMLAAHTRALEAQADAQDRIARLAGLWYVLTWIHIVLAVLLLIVYAIYRLS